MPVSVVGPLPVLLNVDARGVKSDAAPELRRVLAAAGVVADVRPIRAAELAAGAEELGRMASNGRRVVAVAGGDGTISTAAAALAGTGAVLLPIPLGTLNHFARRVGIAGPEDAAQAILAGEVIELPVGAVNDRLFVNNASLGFYPQLVRRRERLRRWIGKTPALVAGTALTLARLPRSRLWLRLPDQRLERTVVGLWVGLGHGSFRLPRDDEPRDAQSFEIVVPSEETRLAVARKAVRVLGRLARNEPPQLAGVEVIHASSFSVAADQPIDLARDGEAERLSPPLEFGIHPAALRVLSLPSEPPAPSDGPAPEAGLVRGLQQSPA